MVRNLIMMQKSISMQNTLVLMHLETCACQKLARSRPTWPIAWLAKLDPRPTNSYARFRFMHEQGMVGRPNLSASEPASQGKMSISIRLAVWHCHRPTDKLVERKMSTNNVVGRAFHLITLRFAMRLGAMRANIAGRVEPSAIRLIGQVDHSASNGLTGFVHAIAGQVNSLTHQ